MPIDRARSYAERIRERALWAWHLFRRYTSFRFAGTALMIWTRRRPFGFAAEAAFWGTFTLPLLFLGVVSAISSVARWVSGGQDFDQQIEDTVVAGASQILTPSAVETLVQPLIDQILRGSATLSVIGFVAALWSGSRIFATFVEGAAVINLAPKRSYWHTRGIALSLYLLGLLCLVLVVVAMIAFSDLWDWVARELPGGTALWVGVSASVALAVAMTIMMWVANPRRAQLRYAFPGGILAFVIWTIGSFGLSIYIDWIVTNRSFYGTISAPIAVMLWVFVGCVAVFVGITVNATTVLYREVRQGNTEALQDRAETAAAAHDKLVAMAQRPDAADTPAEPDGDASGAT